MKKSNAFVLLLASSALLACSQGSGKSSSSSTAAPSSSTATVSSEAASSKSTTPSSDAPIVSSSEEAVDTIAIPTGDAVDVSAAKTILSSTLAKMDAIGDMRLSLKGDLTYSNNQSATYQYYRNGSLVSKSDGSGDRSSLDMSLEVKDLNAEISVKNLNKDGFAASGEAKAHAKFIYEQTTYSGTCESQSRSNLDEDVYAKVYFEEGVGYFDVCPILASLIMGDAGPDSASSESLSNKFKANISIPQFTWASLMQVLTTYSNQIDPMLSAVKNGGVYSLIYSVPCKTTMSTMSIGSDIKLSPDSKFEGSISIAVSFDGSKLLDAVAVSDIDANFTMGYTASSSIESFDDSSSLDLFEMECTQNVCVSAIGAIKASLSYDDVSVASVSDPDDYYQLGADESKRSTEEKVSVPEEETGEELISEEKE
jgi:hypothetical protein